MVIEKYSVVLRRLTHDKIELVRNWRNDPKIAQYMEFQDHITPEMQERWFEKINNENNFFFIIEFAGKDVGLVNVKDVDYTLKQGEGGIFIYDDSLLNSGFAFKPMMAMYDYMFEELRLETIIAHVLKDNNRAIRFNKMQGYKLEPNQDDTINQLYTLNKADYLKAKIKLSQVIK